ncbi:MAG TPA: cobyrinic acid a,c-diamide synthase [Mycobacteriales bacterium]|nr:cobyrinic acid a,c-diamide synthase [Mycobacteriales bacterium]
MTLPGADELFRATGGAQRSGEAAPAPTPVASAAEAGGPVRLASVRSTTPVSSRAAASRPSGREKHDEKITVYVSPEELLGLEHARLELRAAHGMAVDRGRIVREAVAVVLADLEAKGADSILVRRLREL